MKEDGCGGAYENGWRDGRLLGLLLLFLLFEIIGVLVGPMALLGTKNLPWCMGPNDILLT